MTFYSRATDGSTFTQAGLTGEVFSRTTDTERWTDAYLDDSLLLYYPFTVVHTGVGGDPMDAAPNDTATYYDGTATGGTYNGDATFDRYYVFDGADDYIDLPEFSLAEAGYSVSVWVYPTSLSSRQFLFYLGDSPPQVVIRIEPNGELEFFNKDGPTKTGIVAGDASQTVPANTWTHLVFNFDGNYWGIYLDNTSIANVYDPNVNAAFTGVDNQIGRNNNGNYFIGYMAQPRIYDRPLTVNEIDSLYFQVTG